MVVRELSNKEGQLLGLDIRWESEDERLLVEALRSVLAEGGRVLALAKSPFIHDQELEFEPKE